MENKIVLASLAALLAKSTGKSKKLCEDFLREFFRLTAETLENGETLKIKGFGTFKITDVEGRNSVNVNTGEPHEIAPHKKVVFTPAKEIASAINAPFEDFESVEMEDDMPEDLFLEEESKEESLWEEDTLNEKISDEDTVSNRRLEVGSDEEGEDDDITYTAYHEIEEQKQESISQSENYDLEIEASASTETTENLVTNLSETDKEIPEEKGDELHLYVNENEEQVKSRFGIGFLTGALSTFAVCAVIFMLGCFLDWWPVNFGSAKEEALAEQIEQKADTVPEIEPAQEETVQDKEPVYDTVSTTRYLTTIAREHYGNYNFWPYIYLENQSILGHPDRITPGTKVVVPELSKYGVDPKNKEDVAQAKKKAVEIYERFK